MNALKKFRTVPLKIINLILEGVTQNRISFSEQVVIDGQKNDFPEYLIELVSLAPTGSALMGRLKDFVKGKGFIDEDLEKIMVNKDQSFIKFHEQISSDFCFFSRFAVLINPTKGGKIESMKALPVEFVRWGKPDKQGNVNEIYYNPFLNTGDDFNIPRKECLYPIWRNNITPAEIREDAKRVEANDATYKGHILFFNLTSQRNRHYSRPDYFAAEKYLLLDWKISLFHERNVDNNFFLGGILNLFGDPAEPVLHEDGTVFSTVGVEVQKELAASFSGAENAGAIFVNWIKSLEQAASLIPYQANTNHEAFITIDGIVERKLSSAFRIPLILIGRSTPGKLAESREFRDAIAFTNESTESMRQTLEEVYNELLALKDGAKVPADGVQIRVLQDFTDLPDTIFNALTVTQKEVYLQENFNIEPDPEGQQMEQQPAEPEVIEPITDPNNGN